MARIIKTNNGIVVANNKAISVKNYQYADGQIDEAGLAALGWDAESIGVLRDNVPHYEWQDSEYQVSAANKALYGVVNDSNISTYKTNADMRFCPMFDTSARTTMTDMFRNATQLIAIPKFNTSNITRINAFQGCTELRVVPLLDTSNVTTFNSAFIRCKKLTTVPQFNTSRVTNFQYTFQDCNALRMFPRWDFSAATNISNMFMYCMALVYVSRMNTRNVTDFQVVFNGCNSLRQVEEIDMTSATIALNMFLGCTYLTDLRIKDGTPLNVTLSLSYANILSYESIISVLTAASNTTNSNAKTLTFSRTLTVSQSQKDALDALIASCGAKGWTISGLSYSV